MINLMPPNEKRQILAARINVILSRYIAIILCTFIFLMAALAFSYYILTTIKTSATNVIAGNQNQAQANDQSTVQLQALQSSLSSAKVALDSDIDYTKVLSHLGSLVPSGVVVSSLTLSSSTFGAPTTLQALAKTNSDATSFQSKLQASPYFSAVTLQSLNSGAADPAYPVNATFNLVINRTIAQ